ncbi:MAG: Fe(2+)-trafficking protein [Planctomycetota bacterium]|jgi:Fe-S cluster biosynthesis and repair protein YggX
MANLDERIAQFERMATDDPENDMAHFSLANTYLQAGRPADAAETFQRCIELNGEMSKAYQLAGQALIECGRTEEAAAILNTGYEVAARRGDLMPKNAMGALLEQIGLEPPRVAEEAPGQVEQPGPGGAFICKCTGRPGTQLPEPPMRGALGQWIYDNIAAETWREWIGQGTKVINELHLDFSREEDQRVYDQYMCEFLGIDEALYEELVQKVT